MISIRLTEANNVLNNHRFDEIKVRNNNFNNRNRRDNENSNNVINNKEDDDFPVISFTQMERNCYCCGKPGHKSPNCHSKNTISRKDWYIHKIQGQQHTQVEKEEESSTTSNASNKKEQLVGQTCLHYSFVQATNIQQLIVLHSGSSETFFCNKLCKKYQRIRIKGRTWYKWRNNGII